MKKFMTGKVAALGLAVLLLVGSTVAFATSDFRDKVEGPEANPTHAEGNEAIGEGNEATEANQQEGSDKGNGEASETDGPEGVETNSSHAEGNEVIGEGNEATEANHQEGSDQGNGEASEKGNN